MSHSILITVLGPTASGKSRLAIGLGSALGGEIVNCDSMQLIRGMDIGTAKPTPMERRKLPHHLYDLIEPGEIYDAGQYMVAARRVCREISSRGKIPIVVGGTGLYLRALLKGVFPGPGRNQELRQKLERIGLRQGPEALIGLLKKVDPVTSERVHPADSNRVIRALEVFYQSGIPISQLQDLRQPIQGYRILKIGLKVEREVLCDRISHRVDKMFRCGFLDEVRVLLRQGCSPETKGFEAIGYRYVASHLAGHMTLQDVIDKTCVSTRRYAKRQKTWFRREPDVRWIEASGDSPGVLEKALAIVVEGIGQDSPE